MVWPNGSGLGAPRLASTGSRFKRQGHTVVAVAQTCWLWTILEDMALMTTTALTVVFRARHDQLEIRLGGHRPGERLPEARPARATIKLRTRRKEGQPTTGADKAPLAFLVVQRAAEGTFGGLLPQDLVGLRRQAPFPFRFTQRPTGIPRFGGSLRALDPPQQREGSKQSADHCSYPREEQLPA